MLRLEALMYRPSPLPILTAQPSTPRFATICLTANPPHPAPPPTCRFVWPPNKSCACFTPTEVLAGLALADNCDGSALTATFLDDCEDSARPAGATGVARSCRALNGGAKLCVVAEKEKQYKGSRRTLKGSKDLAKSGAGVTGRVYIAHVRVADASGNAEVVPVTIRVPDNAVNAADDAVVDGHRWKLPTAKCPADM